MLLDRESIDRGRKILLRVSTSKQVGSMAHDRSNL